MAKIAVETVQQSWLMLLVAVAFVVVSVLVLMPVQVLDSRSRSPELKS